MKILASESGGFWGDQVLEVYPEDGEARLQELLR